MCVCVCVCVRVRVCLCVYVRACVQLMANLCALKQPRTMDSHGTAHVCSCVHVHIFSSRFGCVHNCFARVHAWTLVFQRAHILFSCVHLHMFWTVVRCVGVHGFLGLVHAWMLLFQRAHVLLSHCAQCMQIQQT